MGLSLRNRKGEKAKRKKRKERKGSIGVPYSQLFSEYRIWFDGLLWVSQTLPILVSWGTHGCPMLGGKAKSWIPTPNLIPPFCFSQAQWIRHIDENKE